MKLKKISRWMCLSLIGMGMSAQAFANPCTSATQLCQLQVLIAQYPTNPDPTATGPGSLAQIEAFLTLAPNLTQLHLRFEGWVPAGQTPTPALFNAAVTQTVALVNAIRALPGGATIALGFHPDNDQHSSAPIWGCASTPTAECVFSNSIAFMNAVNAQLPPGTGFSIFSIEQSYIEPQTLAPPTPAQPAGEDDIAAEKDCLQGNFPPSTQVFQCTVVAKPAVQYGYVSPSCGASNLYDSEHYDYGYPQMYNLTVNWTDPTTNTASNQEGLPLPTEDYPNGTLVPGQKYALMDAIPWSGQKEPPPSTIIPTLLNPQGPDIRSVYQPNILESNTIDPVDAAQVVATVLVKDLGTGASMSGSTCSTGNISSDGSIRYFTLSGEPEFLGGNYDSKNPGAAFYWTRQDLINFFNDLTGDLQQQGVQDPQDIPFAIWSFDTMLLDGPSDAQNNPLPENTHSSTHPSS